MNSIYYYPIRCLRWLLRSGGQWQYICPLLCVCAALYTFWLSSLAWCSFWLLHFMHDWNCIKILACKSSFFYVYLVWERHLDVLLWHWPLYSCLWRNFPSQICPLVEFTFRIHLRVSISFWNQQWNCDGWAHFEKPKHKRLPWPLSQAWKINWMKSVRLKMQLQQLSM